MSPSTDGDAAWGEEFRHRFDRAQSSMDLHPSASTPSATFESAVTTARAVAAECLPFGLALVMHLYPLCALRCVPLPWLSLANARRALLLHTIDRRSLILANAGSERAAGAHEPVSVTRTRGGFRIDGTYEYMSLANVADIVLFSAPLAGTNHAVFCAADLRGDSVCVGSPRFRGSMRLSDTCPVTFNSHHVPSYRCIEIPNESALNCMARYQRSWFQLLLGESYLARIEYLQRRWGLERTVAQIADIQELACMREYALRLLDDAASPGVVDSLARVTAATKLHISWLAQSTAAALRELDEVAAGELGFLRLQPTSDERILRSLAEGLPSILVRDGNQDKHVRQ